jgi:hypothetical protein
MRVIANSKHAPLFSGCVLAALLAALSAGAIDYFHGQGWLQWYGDAEAHLNNARRLSDSAGPAYDQLGSVWLPVPHLAIAPFAAVDRWWHSCIAAAFPAAFFFVAGGVFLFAAVHRVFGSISAALAAAALAALNPNLLYLQSTSMTEAYFFAELSALLYFVVVDAPAPAAMATILACLTRYEGWFLIPFAGAAFLVKRWTHALLYLALASLGPLYWLAHNWWLTGDPLSFYRGPYSPRAIQRGQPYPGLHDLRTAWLYYSTAVKLCAGPGLTLMAIAGAVVALARRAFWPLLILALPPVFYIWSMYSSAGTPIYVPTLWPHSHYNTRYGLAALPLLAFASAALVLAVPKPIRAYVAILVVVAGAIHWASHRGPEHWITWTESRANSTGRRAWMSDAARYLREHRRPGATVLSSGGDDYLGIYRAAGIPLRETFTVFNGLPWDAAIQRPDLHLWQFWAVTREGDDLDRALARAPYRLELRLVNRNEPVIRIYRRDETP